MAYSNILVGAGSRPAQPAIRKIGVADLQDALAKGADDFYAMPTHAMFLCIIYPIVGFALARLAFGYSILPLLYPLASGFALVGPIAALGLYELSRRREAGLDTSATRAFSVFESSSIGAIAALGILLLIIFVIWVAVANAIYIANFGYASPSSVEAFVEDVFTTRAGWNLILVGNLVGLLFAILVLSISVVSFPLLLDRDVGAAVAVLTSVRAVAHNPVTMMVWGLDRGGASGCRITAALFWPHRRDAATRPCHLAPLPQGRGARREPAANASRRTERAALCGRLSDGPLSVGQIALR
jgi:uncharacterized membrane protein